jgi:F0F1-type ATP synthase membrane subunit b/b'
LSQIEKIINLEKEIDQLIEDAKQEVATLLEMKSKKAEVEIEEMKKDFESKVKLMDQQTAATLNKLETEFIKAKEALNQKIEKDYHTIVKNAIDKLKKEVINL